MKNETDPLNPDVTDSIRRAGVAIDAAVEVVSTAEAGSTLALSGDNAIATKSRLASQYGNAVRAREAADQAVQEANKIIEGAQALLRAKLKELEPVLAHAKRLEDGISAVNLYLGRDEYIETIREGAPAPAGTPLTIRQTVLHMDEESALFAHDGGLDASNIDSFVGWMLADPANLDQILPEQLGVIAMRPRRQEKKYDDPWTAMNMATANQATWWLLRNGEQLYLHTTEFAVGLRLVPAKSEFTSMFKGHDRDGHLVDLKPGTQLWIDAEVKADARTRHYMKIALILQGLVDRTTVFHPLPVAELNVLTDAHYSEGFVQIIADEENVLGVGRPSFSQWQQDAIAGLKVGHRVIGYFPRGGKDDDFITPAGASAPKSLVPHTITREDRSSFYFTYERTDDVYRRVNSWEEPDIGQSKTRATYQIDKDTYGGQASYLPVDGINADDLRFYLQSRADRHNYRTLFPSIQATIEFLALEKELEAPFVALIAAELVKRGLGEEAAADVYAAELVAWWKTANKWHRALTGDGDHERKAQAGVIREAERRAGGNADEKRVVGLIRLAIPNAIAIAWRTSDYVAVEAQPRTFENAASDVYVTVHEFTKTGKLKTTKEWVNLKSTQVSRWSILHAEPAFADLRLDVKTKFYLNDTQLTAVVAGILAKNSAPNRTPIAITITEGEDASRYGTAVFNVATRSWWQESRFMREAPTRSFVQGHQSVSVNVARGTDLVDLSFGYEYSHAWNTTSSFDGGPERARAPHIINYGGYPNPTKTVYVNEEEEAREEALGAEWYASRLKTRARNDKGQRLYMTLCDIWERANLEKLHARFMEDFQDESLWPGHLKALRPGTLSYPYRQTKKPAGFYDDTLRALGHAIARGDHDHHGFTVAELLEIHSVAAEAPLPDDLLSLRFPPLVPSTDVVIVK
jgi:hypothetical protein